MSASRLVMATPTLDSASDVTWPAWESPARVRTHLHGERCVKKKPKNPNMAARR